jgi:ribosomal protein S18 acetylase RimI-like enzyme
MSDVLDNPVWHALTTHQATVAVGAGGARRYREDVSVFWGADSLDEAGWADLAELGGPSAGVVLARDRLPEPPPGWKVLGGGAGHQMVATAPPSTRAGGDATAGIRTLTPDDVGEMLALTSLTQPGPFLAGTIELGGYVGVFDGEQLVAMAGERMHLPGYAEISAVCTHPDHRGRGLAGALTRRVADAIVDRGETPILHVRDGNDDAIRVYERLGFTVRRTIEFYWYRAPGVLGTLNRT